MQKTDLVVSYNQSNKFAKAGAVAAAVLLFTSNAMAADSITGLGTGASENIAAALTVALAIFAVGIGIKGVFKGYEYLKSGVTKA